MQVLKIGTRGLLFPFDNPYLTNVYVVIGKERLFILDTFLGLESMDFVKQTISDEGYGDLEHRGGGVPDGTPGAEYPAYQ